MDKLFNHLNRNTHAAPLAVFRIGFGALMLFSLFRFQYNEWIYKLYIEPKYFFSYYGFEWVKPLGQWTYALFAICGLSSLGVLFGFKYRISIITFFLSFTYIELMDKTYYLNHYYFVSVLSFLMIWLPMNRYFAWDAFNNKSESSQTVPAWSIYSLRLMMSIVYFYAGLAKLNQDWLLKAMPLKIWLPSKYDLPILGGLLQENWVHFAFCWTGAVYDLAIPFLLLWKPTRRPAFVAVVVFHVLTRILFPIGMFPYIMIVSALIFFDAEIHLRILTWVSKVIRHPLNYYKQTKSNSLSRRNPIFYILLLFFLFQIVFPFRYLLYDQPRDLFWTENGFRYSWRVMLMEKAGLAEFKVIDPSNGRSYRVRNSDFLTPIQEKQMSTQSDFIIEFAHFIESEYVKKGIANPEVYVDSFVALNGRRSQRYIKENIDLTQIEDGLKGVSILEPYKR